MCSVLVGFSFRNYEKIKNKLFQVMFFLLSSNGPKRPYCLFQVMFDFSKKRKILFSAKKLFNESKFGNFLKDNINTENRNLVIFLLWLNNLQIYS